MIFFKIILALLPPMFLGHAFIRYIFKKKSMNIMFLLPLSYGLGFGFLSQWMLFLGILGGSYTWWTLAGPILCVAFILEYVSSQKKNVLVSDISEVSLSHTNKDINKSELTWLIKIFYITAALYIAYCTFYVFWKTLMAPIQHWDAITTISYKAKVFFFDRKLYPVRLLPHAAYPLHVAFSETWIAINLGMWHETFVKIIFPITFVFYMMFHFYYIKEVTDKRWAVFGIILFVSSNFVLYHATISYRDLTVMFHNCLTVLLLVLWNRKKEDGYFILASLFSGFTTFTKLEGTGYLFIHFLLFLIILKEQKNLSFAEKGKKLIKYTIPCISICLFYYIFKIFADVSIASDRFQIVSSINYIERVFPIFSKFIENLFFSGNWHLLWFILACSLIKYRYKRQFADIRLLLYALCLFFGIYIIIALFTPNFISIAGEESQTVLSRLILHFYPLATFLIVFLNRSDIPQDLIPSE